jgi:uncharacterized protein YjiS (DUF1127 family)
MALLQTDRDNLVGPAAWLHAPALLIAHLGDYLLAALRPGLEAVRQWSIQRHVRAWRTMTERTRQRRALAQLSDRELRDIGITRYEIEFLLRKSRWR